ncbi:MAG TPA: phosphodiester glycosidase family protein [Nocardioidaceae bacterium]|nr:phosphodiester glycosidase family protein [Nocardioidaceae bacterium]
MLRPRTSYLWSAVACALSVSVAVPAVATDTAPGTASGATSTSTTAPSEEPAQETGPQPAEGGVVEHSSDLTDPAPTEPVLTARVAGASTGYFNTNQRTLPVAPGLDHIRFDRYDVRGWVRVNALTAQLGTPGLKLDYTAPGKVSSPAPLSVAIQRDGAIAGVNGDFFDIGDTGAPLGIGVDRQRGIVHGSRSGWNNSFTLDENNMAAVAQTYLQANIVRRGKDPILVTNLNAPEIRPGGIGIYTSAWGSDSRLRVLPGSATRREVVIRRGKVRANRKTISSGPIAADTFQVVGVGEGAKRLARLEVGQRAKVEYGLNRAATRVAIGGNVVLLRDGKVLAPGDEEMHPRTAIGIDRDTNSVIIVAVDGRQWHSRGLTMKETATLLKRMGAEDGLNLDGGGSSTMMARESGEPVGVVNSPSDGSLRPVPNGLEFSFGEGSGTLRGIRVEPAADLEDSHRVLNGLSRVLVARGHDETFDPVPARPTWQGSPNVAAHAGPAGRTVVTGRRPGSGLVTAAQGAATGQFEVRVLGNVHRLETSVPAISLPGKGRSATFDVRGYDAQGFGTWVEPRDVKLSFNRDKLNVRRTGRGFTVTSRVGSANDVIEVSAGGRTTYVGVAVGLARGLENRMNSLDGWEASAYPAKANASLSMTKNRGGTPGKAIQMRYSLYGKQATRAAYLTAVPAQDLPGRTRRLGLWVRGDGKGAWLRAVVKDTTGARARFSLGGRVDWKGWRFVSAPVPSGVTQPLDFVSVYALETVKKRKYAGALGFDDLTVFTERVAKVPATAPLRDPMVADLAPLQSGGLRVAVMSDARVLGSAPDSVAVARTRRTMREIVAANPDLVLINGDLVARGNPADIALAQRLISEELGDKVAWRYLPGEGELGSSGDLAAYRNTFGSPVSVFDQGGTRFVLLNSAQSVFRLGGFAQLVRLRSELRKAATDAAVGSVVVVAHHPTSDPAAGGTAELADAREGELVEELLADFRADSNKTAAYVGSHARRFEVTRTDGVPHVIGGPVSDAARSTLGSFTGWSMLRVAPDGLAVEFRPHVNRLLLNAPTSLSVGAVVNASATVVQYGKRVRAAYPMNVEWLPARGVYVGAPADAPQTAVLAIEPEAGRLTAVRPGTGDLTVRVNGVTVTRTVTVQ